MGKIEEKKFLTPVVGGLKDLFIGPSVGYMWQRGDNTVI